MSTMTVTKAIGIKRLKDNLSACLREIKEGICILVTDRGTVVAELCPPHPEHLQQQDSSLKLHWVRSGYLQTPRGKKKTCRPSGVSLPGGTAARLLAAERAE